MLHQSNDDSTTIITTPAATPTPIPAFAPALRPADGKGVEEAEDLALEFFDEDCRLDAEVEVERCWVAVLAEESMVVRGFPGPESENLPTPLSQQLLVWSQQ